MLRNLLSRVVEIVTSEMPAAKKSRRGKRSAPHHRPLQFESLENRELLSVSPLLLQPLENEGIAAFYQEAASEPMASFAAQNASTNLNVSLTAPAIQSEYITLSLSYTNTGTVDIAAPLLRITATTKSGTGTASNLSWKIPGTDTWVTGNTLDFLATSANGTAILTPNQTVHLEISVKVPVPFPVALQGYNFKVSALYAEDASATFNYSEFLSNFRPSGMSDADFNSIVSSISSSEGTTYGDFAQKLLNEQNLKNLLNSNVAQYSTDEANNSVTATDKDGNVTSYQFDSDGRVIRFTDADGNVFAYTLMI